MSHRELKENVYLEALQMSQVNVEKTMNLLKKMEIVTKEIDVSIITRDKNKAILDLELALASMCILLRKMSENQMITLPSEMRKDMNSIIHSNRFDYDKDIIVYSQKGREEIDLYALMKFVDSILKQQNI